MRPLIPRIAKVIFAGILIALGVGMFRDPVAGDYTTSSARYSGPRTEHLSEGGMQAMGVMFMVFGLGLVFTAFKKANK
jgi:hypothetical protein